jgi:transposase-like protein
MNPGRFTARLRAKVPEWIAEGRTIEDIATAVGITPGSLRSACSRHRIRLGRVVNLRISERAYTALRQQAAQMDMDEDRLARRILETVVYNDLFKALELT